MGKKIFELIADIILTILGIFYVSSIIEITSTYEGIVYYVILGFVVLELIDVVFNILNFKNRDRFRFIVDLTQFILSVAIIINAFIFVDYFETALFGLVFLVKVSKTIYRSKSN